MNLEVITTEDGSTSVFDKTLNTTYHSKFGALQESRHIFIKHGLMPAFYQFKNEPLNLIEVGFGTGLNALLTLLAAISEGHSVHYTGIEKFPFPENLIEQLNYIPLLNTVHPTPCEQLLTLPFETEQALHPSFTLIKRALDVNDFEMLTPIHLVYFDGFGPGITPDMWQAPLFERLHASMKTGGILVTFCAQGAFKRLLKSCGFKVETLPGAPGKREMTRAIKV